MSRILAQEPRGIHLGNSAHGERARFGSFVGTFKLVFLDHALAAARPIIAVTLESDLAGFWHCLAIDDEGILWA